MSCKVFKKNVYDLVRQNGTTLSIQFGNSKNVTKNEYSDIVATVNASTIFYTFPVELNPSEKLRAKHGIDTPVAVLAYLSMLDVEKKGKSIKDFQPENMTAVIFDETYKITYAKPFSQCGDGFLYIVIAGNIDGKK